jgi:hypothetical protein
MIYIGSYACGKCVGKCLTVPHCLTASPRRPRPLGGSVINGTIQQLLDTPRAPTGTHRQKPSHPTWLRRHTAPQRGFIHEDVARHPQRPHSAPTWFHPRGCGKMQRGHHSATQRHTAPHSAPTWFHPRGCGKAPTAPHSAHTAPHSAPTPRGCGKAPHSATQRPDTTRMRQGPPQRHTAPRHHEDAARPPTAPHSAPTWFHCPTPAKMRQGPHSGLSGAVRGGAGDLSGWQGRAEAFAM